MQVVGADDCGPNTVNVTVPLAAAPPDSLAETDAALIADPATPDESDVADRTGSDGLVPVKPLPTLSTATH